MNSIKTWHLCSFLSLVSLILISQFIQAMPPPVRFSPKFPVFSKDSSTLIYLKSQNINQAYSIIHRNTQTGALIKEVPIKVKHDMAPFAATPDGFKLLAKNAGGIGVIHNGTGKLLRTLPYPSKIRDWRFIPVQSYDGVLLAIPSISPQAQTIYLIHTGSGKVIRKIAISKQQKENRLPIIRAIGFKQNRHELAYLQQDDKSASLHIYDIYRKKERLQIKLPKPYYDYGTITYNHNGNMLLINTNDKKGLDIIDLNKKLVTTLPISNSSFAGFTLDNKQLMVFRPVDNKISLVNIKTGGIKTFPFIFLRNGNEFGWEVVQNRQRTKLALPISTYNYKHIERFLILDGQTARELKDINVK